MNCVHSEENIVFLNARYQPHNFIFMEFLPRSARIAGSILNVTARVAPRAAGRLAFELFCMPRRPFIKPAEAAFLATADTFFEMIEGHRTAIHAWGFRGPIVLLAHGWESHSGRWRKLVPALVQAGYQVLAVDAPAHGRSGGRKFTMLNYANILKNIIIKYGPIEAVVAHSVGGAATIWALNELDPSSRPKKAAILGAFSELRYVFASAQRGAGVTAKVAAGLERQIKRITGQPVEFFSIARVAANLEDVHGLLIHDRHDRITRFAESERLHAAWKNSILWPTEGFGHGLTAPPVNEILLDFILTASKEQEKM